MLRGWSFYLTLILSLAVLGGVAWGLTAEYRANLERQRVANRLRTMADEEGPCAALIDSRTYLSSNDSDLVRTVEAKRRNYVGQIVGDDDTNGQGVLQRAQIEGLIDKQLCEQIRLVHDLGEVHPVLALLRISRSGVDPCDEGIDLVKTVQSLTSHRPAMLQALFDNVDELRCLKPSQALKLAEMVIETLHDDPQFLDEEDVPRIAAYLYSWAPVEAAQLGCWLEAKKQPSRLGEQLGCTEDQRNRLLSQYRCEVPLKAPGDTTTIPAGSSVLLLDADNELCAVRPLDAPRLFTVPCAQLKPTSEIHVAVLIEGISFGLTRADLISGVGTYYPEQNSFKATTKEPELKSWYGYGKNGEPLGMTEMVRLNDLASQFGEEVPDSPLRSFCKRSGARFCYDVDWAQVVKKVDGEPVVFLSRPAAMLKAEQTFSEAQQDELLRSALGRPLQSSMVSRIYQLSKDSQLVCEIAPDGFELRWRGGPTESWRSHRFGAPEGGHVPPAARLLAVLDARRDGRPQIVIQRVERIDSMGTYRDNLDEILFLELTQAGDKFVPITRLTVHEY